MIESRRTDITPAPFPATHWATTLQRCFLLVVTIVVWTASAVQGAQPFVPPKSIAWPRLQPVLRPDSPLLIRPIRRTTPSKPSYFALRTSVESLREVVRLVGDDGDAGQAYFGVNAHEEPELQPEDLLSIEPPGPDDSALSIGTLQGDAVAIDGAAVQAEKSSGEKEESPATQQHSFGWLAGTGNQLGMLEWVGRDLAVVDYAAADRASFRISGGHAFRWLNGPDTTDLPPYLFSLFVDVGAGIKASDDWSFDVVVSPSWNTDFANKSYQLFRLPWQAVNTFKMNDEFKLVAGITDLDREDIKLLPVAGFIYKPTDGSKEFDLVFPHPKAAWRLSRAEEGRHWGYIAGELGGNSFSIQRPGAIHDIVTLRDYRLLVGWERRGEKRHACRLEAGWVFGRAVEYASGIGNYNPGDTGMIRLSSDY
ncbi:MAG TPA: hypothetical protein VGM98_21685 [Schlesneria sp.]